MNCDLLFKIAGITINEHNKGKYTINLGEVDENTTFNPLQLEAEQLAKKLSIVDNIHKDLVTALMNGKSITDYTNASLRPNYSGEDVKASFPEYNWGANVPDIILVDNNKYIPNYHTGTFLTRVIQQSKKIGENKILESFIVPRSELKNFARYTKVLEMAESLDKFEEKDTEVVEKLSEDNFVNYQEQLNLYKTVTKFKNFIDTSILSISKSYEINANINKQFEIVIEDIYKQILELLNTKHYTRTQIYKRVESRREELDNNIKKLTKEVEQAEAEYLKNRWSKEAQQKYNDLELKLNNAYDNLNKFKENINPLINKWYSYIQEYRMRLEKSKELINRKPNSKKITTYSELEGYLKSNDAITKIDIEDPIINAYYTDLTNLTNVKNPKAESILEFVRDYLLDYKKQQKLFTADLRAQAQDICFQLAGFNSRHNSDNATVNTLVTKILTNKEQTGSYSIKVDDLRTYFESKGFIKEETGDSELQSIFINKFIQQQNDFYLIYKGSKFTKGETIYLGKRRKSVLETLGIIQKGSTVLLKPDSIQFITLVNTVYAISPRQINVDGVNVDDVYRGFFIYEYDGKFFASRDRLNIYTQAQLFDSREDLINNIESTFYNQRLFNFIFLNLNDDVENNAVLSARDKFYKKGELIRTLNYPAGHNRLNPDFTVRDFTDWVKRTFDESLANVILNSLDSIDKMGIFYTYFRDMPSAYFDTALYKQRVSEVNKVIEDLKTATYKYYQVVQDTYAIGREPKKFMRDNRSRYTRVQEINENDLIPKKVNDVYQTTIPLLIWKSMQHIFETNGIKMELLTTKQLIDKGFDGEHMYAAHLDGIVYINIEKARIEDSLHEYTHLLLGIVQRHNPQAYNTLLHSYQTQLINSKEYETRIKDIDNRYSKYIQKKRSNNEDPTMFILEEMFADDYAKYLLQHNAEFGDVFNQMNGLLIDSKVLDRLTKKDLFTHADSKYSVMELFSSELSNAKKNMGFGIGELDVTPVSQYMEIPEQAIDVDDGIFINDLFDKNGLYRLCK